MAPLASSSPIALVIVNSQYEKRTLWQSVNDAKAMKNVLTEIGFRVIFKTELNKKAMSKAIWDFSNCLQITQGVGLFYFSGYGVQVGGDNYLLPINADIRDQYDVEFEAFSVDRILARLNNAKNDLTIIILDASRDIPYLSFGKRGLARMLTPSGFVIAYPTNVGKTILDTQWEK